MSELKLNLEEDCDNGISKSMDSSESYICDNDNINAKRCKVGQE
jgi:hypothetical protein